MLIERRLRVRKDRLYIESMPHYETPLGSSELRS